MVNIYLKIKEKQVLALSIPLNDIEKLSIHPIKCLQFVTFAICGVCGDLSVMPNGPPVDYTSVSLADHIHQDYYYTPEGNIHGSQICRSLLILCFHATIGNYHIIDRNALQD